MIKKNSRFEHSFGISEKFYINDKDKMNEHLGLRFDGIRACVINEIISSFIQGL